MNQQLEDYEAADSDVLSCAVFLAEKITSADGYAEAAENIVAHYLAGNDVDSAARLADSVESSFVRDKLLVAVADKSAENDDDDYALQLADAIEDNNFREDALQKIAIRKAEKFQFEKAFEIAEMVSHNSHALGYIALKLQEKDDAVRASETVEKVEDAATRINYLQSIALILNERKEHEKALNILETAREDVPNIEIDEERIRVLQSIADAYGEIGRNDKTIETLAAAQRYAELLAGVHRNSILSQISVGFLQAGSLDLADRALDLVDDKTIIAATLNAYANEFYQNGEESEAFETLDEARAILKSQHEREVRNSLEKFAVLKAIAVQFAVFDKSERAIEVALENPYNPERFSALSQIAQIFVAKDNEGLARQTANEITEDSDRLTAIIGMSDAAHKAGKSVASLDFLKETYAQIGDVGQITVRVQLLSELAVRFYERGETETARKIAHENIGNISRIFDDSLKAIALANLGAVYRRLGFELNQLEKDALLMLLRQPGRF